MRLKNLIGDVLLVTVVGVVAVGVYHHFQTPSSSTEPSARYRDAYQGTGADEGKKYGYSNMDDCERFIDTTMAQACRDVRRKRAAADN